MKYQTFSPKVQNKWCPVSIQQLTDGSKNSVVPGNYNSCEVWKKKVKLSLFTDVITQNMPKNIKSLQLISEFNQLITYNNSHFLVITTTFLFPYNSKK